MRVGKRTAVAIKNYKKYRDSILTKGVKKPYKPLTHNLHRSYGRNHSGVITVRHKMRGAKKLYRDISFKRIFYDIDGEVSSIEYDPNRTAFIALITYENKKCEYIIHPVGLKQGDKIICSKSSVEEKPGNCTTLKNISERTLIHCVEIYPDKGASIARAAGTYAEVLGQTEDGYTLVKISSGAVVKIINTCMATIGEVSNKLHSSRVMYKAGQSRNRGIRPTVRGVAMNPVDHPHGGGEGRTGTKRHPVSYTGKLTKGYKTADKNRPRAKFILKQRKEKKSKK